MRAAATHGGQHTRRRRSGRVLHVLVTCEHGGNRIPPRYRRWFRGERRLLESHRGHDPGALAMARTLVAATHARLIATTISRLFVELNRSAHNPRVISRIMRRAPHAVREEILERYYRPYHAAVEADVARAVARGARVLHIGSHSFTPVLDGKVRNADIGLLYDPARRLEVALCARWRAALIARGAGKVRRNYPYAGRGDGLTTLLRRRFGPDDYVGIEIEINQRYPLRGGSEWMRLRRVVPAALREALAAITPRSAAPGSARRSPAAAPERRPGAARRASR
jgi:predicted N-formylglutamate amidohydrolase